jgi:hypothetical protein
VDLRRVRLRHVRRAIVAPSHRRGGIDDIVIRGDALDMIELDPHRRQRARADSTCNGNGPISGAWAFGPKNQTCRSLTAAKTTGHWCMLGRAGWSDAIASRVTRLCPLASVMTGPWRPAWFRAVQVTER